MSLPKGTGGLPLPLENGELLFFCSHNMFLIAKVNVTAKLGVTAAVRVTAKV